MWRVWIEIAMSLAVASACVSPSVWRVWIEILETLYWFPLFFVTLRVEGVD